MPGAENGPDSNLGGTNDKGDGPPICQNFAGDPVNIATGNVIRTVFDFSSMFPGLHPDLQLAFRRTYNSQANYLGPLGYGWTHNYNIAVIPSESGGLVGVRRSSGQVLYFRDNGDGTFTAPPGTHNTLVVQDGQYRFTTIDRITSTFDAAGKLLSIVDIHGNALTMEYGLADFPERLTAVRDGLGRSLQFVYNYNTGLLMQMTDSAGNVILYNYGTDEAAAVKNLLSVTYPSTGEAEVVSYEYDDPNDTHNLTGAVDENGHRYSYSYDSEDRALTSAEPEGKTIALEYGDNDTIAVTNGRGFTTLYHRTVMGGKAYITEIQPAEEGGGGCTSCGSIGSYEYDSSNHLISVTNGRGITRRSTYDSRGNITSKTEAEGTSLERVTSWEYHATFNKPVSVARQSVAEPDSSATTVMSYEAESGLLLSVTQNGFVDGETQARTTTYSGYNGHGLLTQRDGPRTDVVDTTSFAYYPDDSEEVFNRGHLQSITNARGHVVTFADYNQFGYPEQITDANNVVSTYRFDARGRLTERNEGSRITTYAYDPAGNIVAIIPPGADSPVSYSYSESNQITSITDQAGNSISFSYDSEGNLLTEQYADAEGTPAKILRYSYDAFNRLQTIINPDESFVQLDRDENGNIVAYTDALSRLTQRVFDDLDRLVEEVAPGDVRTTYSYDTADNLIQVSDPNGLSTIYGYNDFGERETVVSPDTGTTRAQYDAAGNLITQIDARNITTVYVYDALNRLVEGSDNGFLESTSYIYDQNSNGLGRLSLVVDSSGSTAYLYDVYGQVVSTRQTVGSREFTTGYSYTDRGDIASITYPSSRVVSYERADNGSVTTVSSIFDGEAGVIADTIEHKPFGPIASWRWGNGVGTDRAYDQLYRLTQASVGTVYSRDYVYSANSLIESITDSLDSTKSQEFSYDPLNRLTGATGAYGDMLYAYDKSGNRTSKSVDGVAVAYAYKAGTHLLDKVGGAVSYQYDAGGNLVQDSRFFYLRDSLNRLESVVDGMDITASYSYNANNQRVSKTTTSGTRYFQYDLSGQLLAENDTHGISRIEYVYLDGEPLCRFDYAGDTEKLRNAVGALQVVSGYSPAGVEDVTGDGIIGLSDGIRSLIDGAVPLVSRYYYINDHLGTPQLLVDGAGEVVWRGEYAPFGGVSSVGSVGNSLRFPGQYFDDESGVYYNWHRFYDPSTGRYISADPIGLAGGLNLYAYVQNDPVNFIDPLGLETVPFVGSIPAIATTYTNGVMSGAEPVKFSSEPSAIPTISNLTPGQVNALTTTAGGASAVIYGGIRKDPRAVGAGISLLAEGLLLSSIELLGGDTTGYPNPWQLLWDISQGVGESKTGCEE